MHKRQLELFVCTATDDTPNGKYIIIIIIIIIIKTTSSSRDETANVNFLHRTRTTKQQQLPFNVSRSLQ